MWYLFAFAGALFASVRRANEKKLSAVLHPFTIGWITQFTALPILTLIWLIWGELYNPLHLPVAFWFCMVGILFGFYPLNTWLYVNALKQGQLSEIMPLQGLGPIIALFVAWGLDGQRPSQGALMGIIVIAFGIYVLHLKGRQLHNPLAMFRPIAARYTIFGLVMVAIVGLLDQIAIKATDPYFFSFISTLGAVPVLYMCARLGGAKNAPKGHASSLLSTGSLFGLSYACYSVALATGPVAYVNAVRSAAILVTVLIGVVYLKEQLTWQKCFSTLSVCVGVCLLVLG